MPANNFNTNQTNLPNNNVPILNKQFSTNLDGSLDYEGQQ